MSDEFDEFKALALWAKKNGASELRVEHMEVKFFPDPRVFVSGDEPPDDQMSTEERERLGKAIQDRKLYRSV